MQYRKLGQTDLEVSVIGLGTMTYGEQNTAADAIEQMDYAFDQGINFIDTAEMYPVPPRPETQGETERFVGLWLKESGKRSEVVLASKVTGRGAANSGMDHIRNGPRLDRAQINQAVNASLTRLQTDYIDLYQVHWPERSTNFFGKLGYRHRDDDGVAIEETLSALGELVSAGKVRHIGISNETPWGVMEYLRLSRERNLPRLVSIQNPYSLLNRVFEVGLAEMAVREQVGLLAYSPLAFGLLSGKYQDGARPPAARLTLFDRFTRYSNEDSLAATDAYVALAREAGIDPAQMALAFVNSREFVTSCIIGATTLEQLRGNIASVGIQLDRDLLKAIENVQRRFPAPAP
ncbi:MAG: aryl-alcohol dehydrogenase-like predicted oxidoreductase [Halieaceae bacterium]|jgi:aryl-alcohol dehydrogenase-like predicted oxidoreductase